MTAIHPQFIKAGEEELVVLTRAEFDMLMSIADRDEDAEDVAVFDARIADLSDGRDAVLPTGVSEALLQGKSLLTALRRGRGLDALELATRAGLPSARLAALEDRKARWTVEEAGRLAAALSIDVSVLV